MTRRSPCIVIVTLCVLAFATSVSAWCAWVLWQREIIDKREIGWNPHESVGSLQECKKRESRADARYNPETQKLKPIPAGHTICLPDTVDPRGPKAK